MDPDRSHSPDKQEEHMKKSILLAVLTLLVLICGAVSAQSQEPTQTPYIIYVVVTPTPAPPAEEGIVIQRPSGTDSGSQITILNQTTTSGSTATSTEDLVQRVVATVMAQSATTAGGNSTAAAVPNTGTASGTPVRLSDGSTCMASFQLIGEPSYPAGSVIPRGAVFWKEWALLNTGTCTWTPDWSFVFDSGWQIGNTRFNMNRTTAPGATLTVRLAMVPDQRQNGNYYSTYAFEAPDGTRFGTITSSYTVKDPAYFTPKPTVPPMKPVPGYPVYPEPCPWYVCPPPCYGCPYPK